MKSLEAHKKNLVQCCVVLFLFCVLTFFSSCGTAEKYPNYLTDGQIKGSFSEKFYRFFSSYMHMEDGHFSKKMGRVFFMKTAKGLEAVFYLPVEGGFQILEKPVTIPGTEKVTMTAVPGENLSGYVLRGEATFYLFVKNGKIVVQEAK